MTDQSATTVCATCGMPVRVVFENDKPVKVLAPCGHPAIKYGECIDLTPAIEDGCADVIRPPGPPPVPSRGLWGVDGTGPGGPLSTPDEGRYVFKVHDEREATKLRRIVTLGDGQRVSLEGGQLRDEDGYLLGEFVPEESA